MSLLVLSVVFSERVYKFVAHSDAFTWDTYMSLSALSVFAKRIYEFLGQIDGLRRTQICNIQIAYDTYVNMKSRSIFANTL